MNATETQSQIHRAIGDLQTLKEQWAGVESIDKEREKAEAKLSGVKASLKAVQGEVKEALQYRDKYLAEAREKLAEGQRLDKENKTKGKRLADINSALGGFPELERRLERLDAEFRGKAGEVSNLVGELIKTLREQQQGG